MAAAAAAFLMINESLVAFSVVTHHGMGNNSAMRTEMSLKKARGPGGGGERLLISSIFILWAWAQHRHSCFETRCPAWGLVRMNVEFPCCRGCTGAAEPDNLASKASANRH